MAQTRDAVSAERMIPAPAATIFALLADPDRHCEIDGSGSVRAAKAGSERLTLGSTFGMDMKIGFGYSMVNTVIEYAENRRIAWQTRPPNRVAALVAGGRIWRYELEPADGGTLVRETWDISPEQIKLMIRPMARRTKVSMERTLDKIEQIVTA